VLKNAWAGFNCAIFAYGQTGAGKSFTMMGDGVGDKAGLIPRLCGSLFHDLSVRRAKDDIATGTAAAVAAAAGTAAGAGGDLSPAPPSVADQIERMITIEASYLEIYNEVLLACCVCVCVCVCWFHLCIALLDLLSIEVVPPRCCLD
jgi:hypothetical protein